MHTSRSQSTISTADSVLSYVARVRAALDELEAQRLALWRMADILSEKTFGNGRVYVIGNGGSYANADHLVLHLREAGIYATNVLSDIGWLTATGNDRGFDKSANWLGCERIVTNSDVVVVISGSGDSANINRAAEIGRGRGARVLGLLGMGGGTVRQRCNEAVVLQARGYGECEDAHAVAIHALRELLLTS